MKFAHEKIDHVFRFDAPAVNTLVVEEQDLFRTLVRDICLAVAGASTPAVLSIDDRPVEMARHAEVLWDFATFRINQKPLLSRLDAALEHTAMQPEHYMQTQRLLADIERCIAEWGADLPCSISVPRLSVGTLLKAAGVELPEDYSGAYQEAERILDYMELVRELERDKLFFLINMRSFFTDDTVERFLQTALAHGYRIFLLDSAAHPLLPGEKRLTVDGDLCIF